MLQYDVPLTQDELIEQIIYLKKINIGQAIAIEDLNKENTDLINELLRLAGDNDRLTGYMFESPYMIQTEYVV